MKDFLPLLEQTVLFDGLSREEIAALLRSFDCARVYYPKGSLLWRRGDTVNAAGVVLSGCVQAERNGADGTLHVVARHGAGVLFGDVLTSSRTQRSPVDIVAAENTEVLFLPLAALMRDAGGPYRDAQARLRLNLLAELSDKYWRLYRGLEVLRGPTIRARLARRLLLERDARGSDSFTLPGTRETLASELGVDRSALSRELGRMRREGLLDARRGAFTLRDVPALRRLAEP